MVRLRKTKNGPRGLEAVTDPEASRHSGDVGGGGGGGLRGAPYCPRVKTSRQAFASIQSGNLVVCMSRLSFKGELIFSEKKVENRATLSTEK